MSETAAVEAPKGAAVEAPKAEDLTDEDKAQFAALLAQAPAFRAAQGPSIHPPGDPHYTYKQFEQDSPGAQAAAASQAAELAAALNEIQELQKALSAARMAADPAARAAALRAELAEAEAAIPAAVSGADAGLTDEEQEALAAFRAGKAAAVVPAVAEAAPIA